MAAGMIASTPRNKTMLKADEEMDSCSLCLKTFTDPKILPCFHSYCLNCLNTYTKTNAHNQKFACPLCACECVLPTGGAEELQSNFYIKAAQTKSTVAANTVCEVCEDGTRAERNCLECEQSLCATCSKSHVKMTSSRTHHLVLLIEKSQAGESQMTSKSFCDKHKSDELTFYCRKCSIPICLRCKVTSHEQHESVDLSDVAMETRMRLTELLKGAQKVLPSFHSHLNDVTTYGDHLETERNTLKEEIKLQTQKLHEAIDELCRKALEDVDDEHAVEMARLGMRRKMISDRTTAFSKQMHTINQVICFGSDADIARNKEVLALQLQNMAKSQTPAEMVRLRMEFKSSDMVDSPSFREVFGSLNKVREPQETVQVDEVAKFSVDSSFKAISSVCPTDEGSAWIALGWTADAHLFYRHGVKIETHVVSKTIDCIARDADNDLIMTSNEQKMVGKPGPGFNLDVFATFPGYHPRGLTVTPEGDILICLAQSAAFQDFRPGHKNKVVRLNSSGKMTGEYGADGDTFNYPLRVAVNVNGDICVSDSRKRSVIILKSTGEPKAEYDGNECEGLKSAFEPRGIACDAGGHIFVADSANHAVHMLDHVGRLMRLVLTEEQGLYGPYSVAIDKEEHLWIGCRDADMKVYKLTWI